MVGGKGRGEGSDEGAMEVDGAGGRMADVGDVGDRGNVGGGGDEGDKGDGGDVAMGGKSEDEAGAVRDDGAGGKNENAVGRLLRGEATAELEGVVRRVMGDMRHGERERGIGEGIGEERDGRALGGIQGKQSLLSALVHLATERSQLATDGAQQANEPGGAKADAVAAGVWEKEVGVLLGYYCAELTAAVVKCAMEGISPLSPNHTANNTSTSVTNITSSTAYPTTSKAHVTLAGRETSRSNTSSSIGGGGSRLVLLEGWLDAVLRGDGDLDGLLLLLQHWRQDALDGSAEREAGGDQGKGERLNDEERVGNAAAAAAAEAEVVEEEWGRRGDELRCAAELAAVVGSMAGTCCHHFSQLVEESTLFVASLANAPTSHPLSPTPPSATPLRLRPHGRAVRGVRTAASGAEGVRAGGGAERSMGRAGRSLLAENRALMSLLAPAPPAHRLFPPMLSAAPTPPPPHAPHCTPSHASPTSGELQWVVEGKPSASPHHATPAVLAPTPAQRISSTAPGAASPAASMRTPAATARVGGAAAAMDAGESVLQHSQRQQQQREVMVERVCVELRAVISLAATTMDGRRNTTARGQASSSAGAGADSGVALEDAALAAGVAEAAAAAEGRASGSAGIMCAALAAIADLPHELPLTSQQYLEATGIDSSAAPVTQHTAAPPSTTPATHSLLHALLLQHQQQPSEAAAGRAVPPWRGVLLTLVRRNIATLGPFARQLLLDEG
ncbi:unnamed protein product [Closterium sp. Yama58-4]|nr:unnamed protein product [Closterium sp. Yama58-4]